MSTITGIVHHVGAIETITTKTGKEFRKALLVIQTDGQYPETIATEVSGRALNELPRKGERVIVKYSLSGREYDKRNPDGSPSGEKGYFTSVRVYDITVQGAEPTVAERFTVMDDNPPF